MIASHSDLLSTKPARIRLLGMLVTIIITMALTDGGLQPAMILRGRRGKGWCLEVATVTWLWPCIVISTGMRSFIGSGSLGSHIGLVMMPRRHAKKETKICCTK
jgi:hypothetical protein